MVGLSLWLGRNQKKSFSYAARRQKKLFHQTYGFAIVSPLTFILLLSPADPLGFCRLLFYFLCDETDDDTE